jgi:hypothetical protein
MQIQRLRVKLCALYAKWDLWREKKKVCIINTRESSFSITPRNTRIRKCDESTTSILIENMNAILEVVCESKYSRVSLDEFICK